MRNRIFRHPTLGTRFTYVTLLCVALLTVLLLLTMALLVQGTLVDGDLPSWLLLVVFALLIIGVLDNLIVMLLVRRHRRAQD